MSRDFPLQIPIERDSPAPLRCGPAARRLAWAGLAALCVLHVALLTRKGLWNNEFITLRVIGLDWARLIEERIRLNHMPGYFLMLKAWTLLAGDSEFALRFPSALFSLGAVAMTWRVARRAWGPRAALQSAWVAAAGQNLLSLSSDARMYSAVVFWTVLSMEAYLRLVAGEKGRARIAYVFAGVGGVFFHLLFVLALLVQALHYLAAGRRGRLRAVGFFPMMLAPFVVWGKWLMFWTRVQYKVGHGDWTIPSFDRAFRELLRVVWGDYDFDLVGKASRVVSAPLLIATVAALIWLARRATLSLRKTGEAETSRAGATRAADPAGFPRASHLSTLLPWWLLGPVAAIYLVALKSSDAMGSQRYYAVASAAAPLAVAGAYRAIASWRRETGEAGNDGRRFRWHVLYLFLAFGAILLSSIGWSIDPGAGLKQTARRIAREARPGDSILLCYDGASRLAFSYYGLGAIPFAALKEEDERAMPGGPERSVLLQRRAEELAAGARRLWLVLYRGDKTRMPEALAAPDSPFHAKGREWTCGETRLFLFEE